MRSTVHTDGHHVRPSHRVHERCQSNSHESWTKGLACTKYCLSVHAPGLSAQRGFWALVHHHANSFCAWQCNCQAVLLPHLSRVLESCIWEVMGQKKANKLST